MTLEQRIKTWQDAAKHHWLPYYGITVVMEPFLLQKELAVIRVHVVQTHLETPLGNSVRITFKRGVHFNGRRIEIRVNGGPPMYFGPSDAKEIETLIAPL